MRVFRGISFLIPRTNCSDLWKRRKLAALQMSSAAPETPTAPPGLLSETSFASFGVLAPVAEDHCRRPERRDIGGELMPYGGVQTGCLAPAAVVRRYRQDLTLLWYHLGSMVVWR